MNWVLLSTQRNKQDSGTGAAESLSPMFCYHGQSIASFHKGFKFFSALSSTPLPHVSHDTIRGRSVMQMPGLSRLKVWSDKNSALTHTSYLLQVNKKYISQRLNSLKHDSIDYYLLIVSSFIYLDVVFDTIITENNQIMHVFLNATNFPILVDSRTDFPPVNNLHALT